MIRDIHVFYLFFQIGLLYWQVFQMMTLTGSYLWQKGRDEIRSGGVIDEEYEEFSRIYTRARPS